MNRIEKEENSRDDRSQSKDVTHRRITENCHKHLINKLENSIHRKRRKSIFSFSISIQWIFPWKKTNNNKM